MEHRPLIVSRRFGDVDELGELARDWDLDFRQLDRGRLDGSVTQWVTPTLQLARASLSRRMHQRGTPPRRLRTFAIPTDPRAELYWHGHHVHGDRVRTHRPGAELESISAPGYDVLVVSVEDALLDEAASRIGQGGLTRLLGGAARAALVTLPPGTMDLLRIGVARALETGLARPSGSSRWIHAEIPALLVRALGAAAVDGREPSTAGRARVVHEAMALVRGHGHELTSVSDLCRLVGATERSLQRGFREIAGVSPKEYLVAHRLDGVRRALRWADPSSTRVADIANEWGYWHMGQFAADYRRHFGEMPSETLRRQLAARRREADPRGRRPTSGFAPARARP
jgi:AraC family ethanolamine operon transcriptional activator